MTSMARKWPAIFLAGLALLMASGSMHARENWRERLNLSSILEFDLAMSTDHLAAQKSKAIYTPELRFELNDSIGLTGIVRIRGDASDKLEPRKTSEETRGTLNRRLFIGNELDVELREFYADIDLDNVYLRLGKQQIVWGEADGLKVLDVLNPQSFREFILPEFEDSRIPLWTANAEITIGDNTTAQLVWIPDQSYDDLPGQDSVFAFTSQKLVPQPPVGIPVFFNDTRTPDNFFTDSDIGAKLSAFVGGWELSVNYFYHYFDRPALRQHVSFQGIDVTPVYERTHLLGTTFNNAFGDWVLRGEIGFSTNRFFLANNLSTGNGLVESGEFSYVLGIDYQGFTDTFISAQFFQTIITDYENTMK